MRPRLSRAALPLTLLLTIVCLAPLTARGAKPSPRTSHDAAVDRRFARWTSATPGCAIGVSVDGKPVLEKAYGMADLEHDVPNRPDTIFEAGSVSKQFTAAAILLLARDGKLSLDDPARKYLPELPAHANEGPTPITIRQLLTHTSGLRDWGSVAAIAGWPRTTRVYTHANVLDIVSRQRALNFTPGTRWSYSNTGYNLAAIIVARVSGQSFADFTKARIFEPLGMSHTSWRDDFTRVVKGRAMAYDREDDGRYSTLMPFENVHGNGGLLTTVGDLLKWNENFVRPVVGDAAFVAQQQVRGTFNDGREHGYAFGLQIGTYKGLREVSHSGATAGYRSELTRFPEAHLSVAVLCNAGESMPGPDAHAVADLFLARRLKAPDESITKATHTLTSAEMDAAIGIYRQTDSGSVLRIVRDEGGSGLRIAGGPTFAAQSATRFVMPQGFAFEITGTDTARMVGASAVVEEFERMPSAAPAAERLASLAGEYVSDEAEVAYTVVVTDDKVVLRRRPDRTLALTPLYVDAFRQGALGTVVFERDASGRAVAFHVTQDRVWNLRFEKRKGDQ